MLYYCQVSHQLLQQHGNIVIVLITKFRHGEEMKPSEFWGWKTNRDCLSPAYITEPPAPAKLLKVISCSKYGCWKRCGCTKAGLRCSIMCTICIGHRCLNSTLADDLIQDDEETSLLQKQKSGLGQLGIPLWKKKKERKNVPNSLPHGWCGKEFILYNCS